MSGHTPGPWTCFYKSKYDEWHVSIPVAGSSMKWALFDDGVRSENPEADARLIAAAPDLLSSLIEVTDLLNMILGVSGGFPPGADGPAVKAASAIARATGVQS